MNKIRENARVREQGAVLITSLLLLLLMTVLGISAMDTNIMEEKMASNMRDRNMAFQAAEKVLRACEAYIGAQTTLPDISNDGSTSIWDNKKPDPNTTNNVPWWEESGWDWESTSLATNAVIELGDTVRGGAVGTSMETVAGLSSDPLCLIERMPLKTFTLEAASSLDDASVFFRITARGVGGSDSTVVILQSVYKY